MKKIASFYSLLALCVSQTSGAAVTAEEAAKLGTSLTPLGAEMAGNAEGTIPAWSKDVDLQSSDPIYITNPLKDEQILFTITKENMAEYADKLSEGSKKLLMSKPGYKMDVYETLRTAVAPDFFHNNTKINATQTQLTNDGLTLSNWEPGTPFPIPQNGLELIWNHLVRWIGKHYESSSTSFYVDSRGNPVQASTQFISFTSPAFTPELDWGENNNEWVLLRADFSAPARRAGEITLVREPTDFSEGNGRKAWQYLAGQRRVRLAPMVAFDTPAPATAGNSTYDDSGIYNGSPERFNWKMIGKQECYMPYNNWRTTNIEDPLVLMTANYFNTDYVRWELHRCWVVEATLKEGSRHIYQTRRYYIDEDTWTATMGDLYDLQGQLWRANFSYNATDYTSKAFASVGGGAMYDFQSGIYSAGVPHAYSATSKKEPKDPGYYTSSALKRSGVR